MSNFGNAPIEVTKSEIFNDRLIIGYKIGFYEVEFSYDSDISLDLLQRVMENDRITWLRDLSRNFDEKQTSGIEFDLGNLTNNSLDNLTLKGI